jgi:hypothetical protein
MTRSAARRTIAAVGFPAVEVPAVEGPDAPSAAVVKEEAAALSTPVSPSPVRERGPGGEAAKGTPARHATVPLETALETVLETAFDSRVAEPAEAAAASTLAAAWEPTVAADRPASQAVARVLPRADDPAFGGWAPRPEAAAEPAAPTVHIGVVEVVVAAPQEKPAPAAAPARSVNLASRRYLRSL